MSLNRGGAPADSNDELCPGDRSAPRPYLPAKRPAWQRARPSVATSCSASSAAAGWERSTPPTIPSSIARSPSSCCARAAARDAAADGQTRLLREAQAIARLSASRTSSSVYDVGTLREPRLHRHGVRRGAHARATGCRQSRARWREVLDVFVAAGRGPGRCARRRSGPPRLQARQRHDHAATARSASWTSVSPARR